MDNNIQNNAKQIFFVVAILLIVVLLLSIGWLFNSITSNACQICNRQQANPIQQSGTTQPEGITQNTKGKVSPNNIVDGNFIKSGNNFILLNSKEGKEKKIKISDNTSFVKAIMDSPNDNNPENKKIQIDDLEKGDSISVLLKRDSTEEIADKVRKIKVAQ